MRTAPKLGALLALVAIAVPILPPAASAAKPRKQRPRVLYVLHGRVTQYIAPAGSAIGSISLVVTGCNRHGDRLSGMEVTFGVSNRTKLVLGADGLVQPGERVSVKVRAPEQLKWNDLVAVGALQVIAPGARPAPDVHPTPSAKRDSAKPASKRP